MNMHEWMMANPRPDRPQFDFQAMQDARGTDGGIRGYLGDWRSQMGDWRGDMQDWRQERRDYRHDQMGGGGMPGQGNGPSMQHGPGPNTQFPLNPGAGGPIQGQQVPGSSYGFNLGDVLQRFPNGLPGLRNSQPGLNPGY